MNVVITGSGSRVREKVKDIAYYTAHKLMPRVKNVEVEINLIPNLLLKEGIYGDCFCDPEFINVPKNFIVRIDSRLSHRDICIAVAHEMIHVKQFAKRELYDSKVNSKSKWQGKWLDRESLNYWDYPWEIEAHGREIGIFIQWCNDRGYGRQKWTQIPLYPDNKKRKNNEINC